MHIELYEEVFAPMQQPINLLEIGGDSPLFNDYFEKLEGATSPYTVIIDHGPIGYHVPDPYASFQQTFSKWNYKERHAVYIIERLDTMSSAQTLKQTIEKYYPELAVEIISFLVDAARAPKWEDSVLVRARV